MTNNYPRGPGLLGMRVDSGPSRRFLDCKRKTKAPTSRARKQKCSEVLKLKCNQILPC